MVEPTCVFAGDSWSWTRPGNGYPASAGWTLTYYLAIGTEDPNTIICTASGDDHLAAVAAPSAWPAGDYHWMARVKNGAGETHSVGSGVLRVLPDPSTPADRRSPNELALAAVTAVLAGRMGDLITEYEIDGVKAKTIPHLELIRLRGILLGAVRREQGGDAAVVIPVRFRHV